MLLSAIFGQSDDSKTPGPGDDFWFNPVSMSASGVRVTPESAMRASAVYACIKVIAETIATTSLKIKRKRPDGFTEPANNHPLQKVLGHSPHPRLTAFEWFEMQVAFSALYGNAYALIIPGELGAVTYLEPIRPDRVRVEENTNGNLIFEVSNPHTGERKRYTEDEMFRMPGFSFNGKEGIAPIVFANDPIGLALATESFGARFFSQDATPSGVLTHPSSLTDESRKNLKKSWRNAHAGLKNAYSIALLEEGVKFEPLAIGNKDSQFIETRKYQIGEIARFFRIPLHMVNDLEKSSFNNIEQQSIEFVKYTINPWCTRIEQRINKDLILKPELFEAKFDLDTLLRGERKARFEGHGIAIEKGFMTRNEVREAEGLSPLEGLDDPLTPLNMERGDNRQQQQEQAANMFLNDISGRVTRCEIETFERFSKKHAEKFSEKMGEFYETKLYSYLTNALEPYVHLHHAVYGELLDTIAFADDYTRMAMANINTYRPAEMIGQWKECRQKDFCDMLMSGEYAEAKHE